jgi:catechol 2,3-dioxygenase-like lactoylglutathione lyase family enzyme
VSPGVDGSTAAGPQMTLGVEKDHAASDSISRIVRFRVARHTDRLEEVTTFYRDQIGLPELGRFSDHDGYDGVFLDIPGAGSQLEFTAGGDHLAPKPHPESVLVLYLDTQEELDAVAERVAEHEVTPANPYWLRNARAFADPDGYQVLLTLQQPPAR